MPFKSYDRIRIRKGIFASTDAGDVAFLVTRETLHYGNRNFYLHFLSHNLNSFQGQPWL